MKLNLGSGYRKQKGYYNLDIDPRCEPHIVADMREMPFPDSTFSFIQAHHILEHVIDPINAMLEIYRVLKLGGILQLEIPFFPGRMAFAAWDHVSYFTPDSFALLFNPIQFQPKMQPHDLMCKFIMLGKMEIDHGKTDWISEDMKMGRGDITGRFQLVKINPKYWRLQNVHNDLKTQVYGCFYCLKKLKKISADKKICPNCNVEYTWRITKT